METHAHHLHKAPGKGFKHYFFEFFMLFLAVFCGFFAENLRESNKEKEKLHLDMQSVLSDLNSDAFSLDSAYMRNEYGCAMADSLITLLNTDLSNTSEIYFLARAVTANLTYFYSNSKTFDQMTSSGSLKFVKPRSLLDSLAGYYSSFQWMANQTDLQRLKADAIHKENALLFSGSVFQQMMHIDYNSLVGRTQIQKPEGNPPLLSSDRDKINAVIMNYHYYYSTTKFYDRAGKKRQEQALRLIEMIKKEYHD